MREQAGSALRRQARRQPRATASPAGLAGGPGRLRPRPAIPKWCHEQNPRGARRWPLRGVASAIHFSSEDHPSVSTTSSTALLSSLDSWRRGMGGDPGGHAWLRKRVEEPAAQPGQAGVAHTQRPIPGSRAGPTRRSRRRLLRRDRGGSGSGLPQTMASPRLGGCRLGRRLSLQRKHVTFASGYNGS
jgi:hypothetical protein